MFSFVGYFGLGRPPARAQNSRKKLRLRREYSSANRSPAPAHRDPLHTKFHLACRRRGAFCKGIVSTPARRGPTFVRAKVGKTRSRGTDSPLTNPFLSLAVLDTNDAKASSVLRTDTLSRCLRRILFGPSRNRIKNQPYKRRRVGRNLRLSRADPALCSGQPSPLRCILLSPQGLTTLRGPQFYGAYRRVGFLGRSPK